MKSLAICFLLSHTAMVSALPVSPEILTGSAEFVLEKGGLVIQVSDQSELNWGSFSISADEMVAFQQPASDSLVVNRVIGNQASQIFGSLNANGKVILINPNGVLFGKDAQIDTGSFIASTLDLQGDFFAKGKIFKGSSGGAIVNMGTLIARQGDISLIASNIDQQGTIHADHATIALIGSNYKHGLECQFLGEHVSRINQSGKVSALGGQIHLMAGEIFAFNTSEITTSSAFSGGEILVGAGLRGKDPAFTNAKSIWVDSGASFLADSWEEGQGGRVILFSDQVNDFSGRISAQGGRLGGDGGLVEISSLGSLGLKGDVQTQGPKGKGGTLLIDPTNVTIGPGGDVNTTAGPVYGYTAANVNIDNTLLSGFLNAGTSVTIDTTPAFGQPGIITVTGAVAWSMASANLTLIADDRIDVFADIQDSFVGGGGGVTLISTNGINIGPAAANVSVGSLSGPTIVNTGGDVTIRPTTGSFQNSQIGFFIPPGFFATPISGSIAVTCRNLNLLGDPVIGPLRFYVVAAIGHGGYDSLAPRGLITTPAATITILANNDITLQSGAPDGAAARIGHGSSDLDFPGGTLLQGDISVRCGGDILLESQQGLQVVRNAGIGHGIVYQNTVPITINANISVTAGGDITLRTSPFIGGIVEDVYIGHFCDDTGTVIADVDVHAGGSISMLCDNLPVFQRMWIGQIILEFAAPRVVTTNVRVCACQDLIMRANAAEFCYIGTNNRWATVNQTVSVVVGRDLIMADTIPTAVFASGGGRIGAMQATTSTTSTTFVAVGRDINMGGVNSQVINAFGNVIVTAGGNINVQPLSFNSHFIGSDAPTPGFLTRIWAAGNIIGQNSPNFGLTFFGFGPNFAFNHSLDMRAGGDIQIPYGFFTDNGLIYIEADTVLPLGSLWTNSGGAVNSIGAFALPLAVRTTLCPGLAISASSAAIFCNGLGGTSFDSSPFGFVPFLQTNSGNIFVHSAPAGARFGNVVNLSIGFNSGIDNLTIFTTSGDIEIFGSSCPGPCVRGNSFNDVTINQDICTTGSVLIAANHNLNMTATSSIGGPLCAGLIPSSVTLIADNDFPVSPLIGPGGFFMDANAFIDSTGPIRIFTARQSINAINGFIRNTTFGATTLYECTNQESWCTYFCAINSDCPMSGFPFTISYKDGCVLFPPPAPPPPEYELFYHLTTEFPGWQSLFWLVKDSDDSGYQEPYYTRRKHVHLINHPMTWTTLIDTRWEPLISK